MGLIFTDIETLPATDAESIELIKSKMRAPGNYKKPDSTQDYLNDPKNIEEAVRKTSFDAMFGSIFCISYAIDDGETCTLSTSAMSEKDMLLEYRKVRQPNGAKTPHEIIGHYIKGFDIPFMSQRMMLHGIGPLFDYGTAPYKMLATCTGEMWSCGGKTHPKLDTMCKAFGIDTPKDGIDGSMVYDFWLDGRYQEIEKYCERDVEAVRDCYRRMTAHKAA